MLKKVDAATVISDEGYEIEIDFRFIKYTESNGNLVKIDVEHAGGQEGIIIYTSVLNNWDLPIKRPITPSDKQKIIQRLEESLKFLDKKYLFE